MNRDVSKFLELRQQLKDSIRKKTQNGNDVDSSLESEPRNRKFPNNNFGSFFGPSQTMIAPRVLQESKALYEKELLSAKQVVEKKSSSPITSGSETKNTNEPMKRKAEKLKEARDYSFLFSDDAELPVSLKEPASRDIIPIPKSKPRQMEHSKPASPGSKMHPRTGSSTNTKARMKEESIIKSKPSSKESRINHSKPASSSSQMHPRTSSSTNTKAYSKEESIIKSKTSSKESQMYHSKPASSGSKMHPRTGSSTNTKVHTNEESKERQMNQSKPASSGSKMHPRTGSSSKSQAHTKEELVAKSQMRKPISKNGQSSSRLTTQRPVPTRKPDSVDNRRSLVPKQERVEQRKIVSQEHTRSQMIQRKALPSSISNKQQPLKQQPQQVKNKKRKLVRRTEEDDLALQMVREMCGSDRYKNRDYNDVDDRNMEANYNEIQKEEKRSTRLARKEDAEQLRLIEEENRQERLRKKQKLSH